MRLLFALLVVVNIAVLAWHYIVRSEPPTVAVNKPVASSVQPDDVPPSTLASQTITLLDEVAQKKALLKKMPSTEGVSAGQVESSVHRGALQRMAGSDASLLGGTCYWFGPFLREDAQEEYAQRLGGEGVEVERELSTVSGGWRYWVYLPAKSTRKEARAQLSVLQGMKIDSYLIQKGEKANGISLGLFSRKELADAKYQAIKAKGFAVEVDAFERIIEQRWLVVKSGVEGGVGESVLSRMAKNEAALQLIEKKCELPVASHNNIH